MTSVEKLLRLMEQGWNIHIECKGKGRVYEMTFEAIANRVITDEMPEDEKVRAFYPTLPVFGATFDELIDKLEKQLIN